MKNVLLVLLAITVSGCAGVINGSKDTVIVNSLEKGTVIFIDGNKRGLDDAMAELERGDSHTIKVTKKGCEDVIIETSDGFDKASLWGILIDFGIITIPIDLITGNAWELDPKLYTVSPICNN